MTTQSNPPATAKRRALKPKRTAPEPAPQKVAPHKAAYSMDDIAESMGVSVPIVYDLVNEGLLTTFLIGRRRLARPAAIEACVVLLEKKGAVLPWKSGMNNRPAKGAPTTDAA